MRYLDPYRLPAAARALSAELHALGRRLATRRQGDRARAGDEVVRLMEVCGSHTMAIARHALRDLLPPNVRLVSGPGCPVCVTDAGYVDAALDLARRGVAVATFGDMVRVPGSEEALADARAAGATVRVCYSPAQALEWAADAPGRPWVMLAVGFETTAAPLAALAQAIRRRGLRNLTLLTSLKLVPPALDALVADPALKIDGFLCPAHVSAIIGTEPYEPYARDHGLPCVVASFEPLDILLGVRHLLGQLVRGEARVENLYRRVVRPQGNRAAQALMTRVFEPVDARWRGLGELPRSGLGLAPSWRELDASVRFERPVTPGRDHPACRCGDVLKGVIEPSQCPLFGKACTPARPLGPCMVSSEGSCAAAWKYRRLEEAPGAAAAAAATVSSDGRQP